MVRASAALTTAGADALTIFVEMYAIWATTIWRPLHMQDDLPWGGRRALDISSLAN